MSQNSRSLTLVYSETVDIRHESVGLSEPSGVALTRNHDALWVVSDDKKRIFKIDFDGHLRSEETIRTQDKELEGITVADDGTLFAISEAKNKLIVIGTNDQTKRDQKLEDMKGYKSVAQYFSRSDDNKGLEGIAVQKDSLFVLKESDPGILIKISKDLRRIKDHKCLGKENGFGDDDTKVKKIDYSGICYDPSRHCFWIVSDTAKRLFLYSWEDNKVFQSFALGYEEGGDYREIQQAEGVTYNPDNRRLYIVSDMEARLYVFEVQ